jgi:peptide/nickel transport system permease protein
MTAPAEIAAPVGAPEPGRSAPRLGGVTASLLRLIAISVTIFLFATVITFSLRALSGITPVSRFIMGSEKIDPADEARILAEWGLDKPLPQQYVEWLAGVLRGDLGLSWIDNYSVTGILLQRVPVSLSVALLALLIGVTAGFALGITAALRQGSALDRAITVVASVLSSIPSFIVAIVLILVFSVGLGWFPAGGYVRPDDDLGGWLRAITLPAIALSLDTIGDIARQLRNGLVGTMQTNYATGALLRGLTYRRVFFGHALRNGVGPAITIVGMKFPFLLGGAVITEQIFALPGYGVYTTQAASWGDVPIVQGSIIISVVMVLVFNLGVNQILNVLSPASRRGI